MSAANEVDAKSATTKIDNQRIDRITIRMTQAIRAERQFRVSLEAAARSGRIRTLKGLGGKLESRILAGL